jgi:glycerate 2-kinase
VAAVAAAAERMGLDVLSLGADIEGEAAMVGKEQAALAIRHAQARAAGGRPFLIVSGGETTVTHKGETREGERPGRGGRNAEYLLSLALSLEGQQDIYALACDTDGIDGSEDNAGAILDPQTLARARSSIDPQRALDRHDAYSVFEAAGDLVVTGPTRTNVNDLRLILIQPIQNNS